MRDKILAAFQGEWAPLVDLKGKKFDYRAHLAKVRLLYEDCLQELIFTAIYLELVCHGPWKRNRILLLAERLIETLAKDPFDEAAVLACYPLQWQKDLAKLGLMRMEPCWQQIFESTDKDSYRVFTLLPHALSRRYKVYDIFLGRYLGIPSFPIDRHIQRSLERIGLGRVNYLHPGAYDLFLAELADLGYDPVLLEYELIGLLKK